MSHSGRVVVGVSGTPTSLQALRTAVAEARSTGSSLVAVLAWTPVGGEISYRRAPCPPLLRLWEDEAAWRLRNSFDEALGGVPQDVPVELVTVRGEAGAALVDVADQADDLLVVGAGPRGARARLFHGATTRYCVGHAACRVLSVPAPELLAALPRALPHRVPAAPRELTTASSARGTRSRAALRADHRSSGVGALSSGSACSWQHSRLPPKRRRQSGRHAPPVRRREGGRRPPPSWRPAPGSPPRSRWRTPTPYGWLQSASRR
ncbi:universal stress protein [Streptacidiphilus anmyonensis]|uniref:universal stress protein n=1 Tax=Streptacidiphilus anmyonensis TaxID=405782 RepID=UPI0009FC83B3|nr:universal stress protein [Streptacidiphilus anmyonensis]